MNVHPPSSRAVYSGFDHFFAESVAPFLLQNETRRKKAVEHFMLAIGATTTLALALLVFFPVGEARFHAAFAAALIGAGLSFTILSKASAEISHGLFQRLCAFFDFNYQRTLSRPAYYEPFRRLGLLGSHNKESWEDEVKGAHDGVQFVFCEAKLQRETSGKKKRTRTVFHGQLIVIDYPKSFLGETVVKRDVGVFNGMMKPSKEFNAVGIASPKFEKIFEAWSTDQVEARELLDPIVLERFEELDRLFGGARVRAAFSAGKLYVALETGDKLNMGSMFEPLTKPARIEKILKEFDLLFDLIDVAVKQTEGKLDAAFSIAAVKSA